MGFSSSPAVLAGKLDRYAAGMDAAANTATGKAALAVKTAALAELSAVGVHGARLRNVGRKGRKLGVRYTIKGGPTPTAIVSATGPWPLVEENVPAHLIPRGTRRRDRKKRPHLFFNEHWWTGPVRHPGTTGKHPWGKAWRKSRRYVRPIYDEQMVTYLRKSFQ